MYILFHSYKKFIIIYFVVAHYSSIWRCRFKERNVVMQIFSRFLGCFWKLCKIFFNRRNYVDKRHKSASNDHDGLECISSLHDEYVIVPVDKASNNIVLVWKALSLNYHRIGHSNNAGSATYKRTTFDNDETTISPSCFL